MRLTPRLTLFLALVLFAMLPGPLRAQLQNQLDNNPSPYLAMHATDPTAWQTWSRQAVELARKQKKLVFVSVGYFSCHWCHVMQKESYRDKQIAEFINRHFIPVKIDRETEPALDAHLIAFADRTQGYSGWPLNVFLTPDGYPLYAAVYLPPRDFLELMQKLQGLWQQDAQNLATIAAAEQPGGSGPGKPIVQDRLAKELSQKIETVALQLGSPMQGGFGDANKFPYATQLDFLLGRVDRNSEELKKFLRLTLDNMAHYGLRDHLQGGFFRYTVDPGWKTPHFEKMLYDNAQLAMVYMKAGKILRDDFYFDVARDTLGFMADRMRRDNGAMIASLSAIDDKGVEGGYYLWDKSEVERLLAKEEWQVFRLYAGMVDPPPLEEGYLPMQATTESDVASTLGLPVETVRARVRSSKGKLLKARSQRKLPEDNKLLAGWNGLALAAFSMAAREFSSDEYRQTAKDIRDYLVSDLWNNGQLYRAIDKGKRFGRASLEDYAAVARGLLYWARLTGETADFHLARDVVLQAWSRFYTKRGWRLSEPGFIPMEAPVDAMIDDHLPSPSGLVLNVSRELAVKLNDPGLLDRVRSAANSGHGQVTADPFWFVSHVQAMNGR